MMADDMGCITECLEYITVTTQIMKVTNNLMKVTDNLECSEYYAQHHNA